MFRKRTTRRKFLIILDTVLLMSAWFIYPWQIALWVDGVLWLFGEAMSDVITSTGKTIDDVDAAIQEKKLRRNKGV